MFFFHNNEEFTRNENVGVQFGLKDRFHQLTFFSPFRYDSSLESYRLVWMSRAASFWVKAMKYCNIFVSIARWSISRY